ncbi:MAG TPA: GMC family oxidoreductase [Bradyrhizobium sp.]|nr:GMC family oxidoreductase [Bradyrhizobium sp.]
MTGKPSQKARGYDAVVIGAGLGGSTLAYRLARHGMHVLVLEKGDFLKLPPRQPHEPVGIYLKSFPSEPNFVGGPTKFYGAAMYRMRESDFRAIRHEAGESPAWPITYDDLEPYYCEAERIYRVHGASEGDPTEPPRRLPFPHPPLPHTPLVTSLVDRLQQSGTPVSSTPRALDYGPGGKCVLCSTCDAYYCRLDAKMDAETAALRPALGSGYVELMTRAQCLRILTSEDGSKATGVLIERDGEPQTLHADVVALCAGVESSARLLLESRTAKHPHGIGNSNRCVGLYYGGHTTGMLFPILSLTKKLPEMHTKTFSINAYYDGAPDWPYPLGVIQSAGQMPFWDREMIPWWKRSAAKLVGERSVYCFYMTEALPTRESGFQFSEGRVVGMRPPVQNTATFEKLRLLAIDAFRRAGYRVLAPRRQSLWHPTGTVRFGTDPRSSVLDRNCKVHDIDRLFVVDASVLPSAGAVNTGLTIAALALKVGDAIAGVKHSGLSKFVSRPDPVASHGPVSPAAGAPAGD